MDSRIKSWGSEEKHSILRWSARNRIKNEWIWRSKWVDFEFGGGTENKDMKFWLSLPLPCLLVASDTWYRRTVRVHPLLTYYIYLRFKAVDSVRSDGTVVSPWTDDRESYWFLTENLEFRQLSGTVGQYDLLFPYRWSRKLLVFFNKTSNFLPRDEDVVQARVKGGSHRTVGR
jgi:hypothetical protein